MITCGLNPFRRTYQMCLGVVCLLLVLPMAATAETPPLAKQFPPGAIAFVEVAGLGNVIQQFHDSNYVARLSGSDRLAQLVESDEYRKAQAARQIVETQLGEDVWTLAEKLLGDRLAVALYAQPGSRQQGVLAVLRVRDTATLDSIRQRLDPLFVLAGDGIDTTDSVEGIPVIRLGKQATVAIDGRWLAVTNSRPLLVSAIALHRGSGQPSLAKDDDFVAMRKQMGQGHVAVVFVDTEVIRSAQGGWLTAQKLDNPLTSLLVGGILDVAARSPYAGLAIDVENKGVTLAAGLAASGDAVDEAHQCFFSDSAGRGTPAIPQPPGVIAGFGAYRDFASWYDHREDLLVERLLPGFDKFEAGLANLLPGKDFSQDVLPLIGSNFTFVAAQQEFSHLDGTPGIQLPGFAMIVELAEPQEAAEIFQLFFQTFSAILNLQSAQQGRDPWVLTFEEYKGVPISYGRYSKKPAGERLHIVYNFVPAACRVADKYVISSSIELCRSLVDQLHGELPEAPGENRNLRFELYPDSLVDILDANRDYFVAQMVRGGQSAEAAKGILDEIFDVVRGVDTVRFNTGVDDQALRIELEARWK